MSTISSSSQLYLSVLVTLSCATCTIALPFTISLPDSYSTLPESSSQDEIEKHNLRSTRIDERPASAATHSLPRYIHTLSKRYSDDNVGAAIGPLIGAVVILFTIYFLYQRWRKRKDKDYFFKKEGGTRSQGNSTTASPSTGIVGEKGKSSQHSDNKAVASGGVVEVLSGDRAASPPSLEEFPSRKGSNASSQLTVPTILGSEKRSSNASCVSLSSLSQGMQGPGGARLSQGGAQRKVEVMHIRRPELARTRAPVRGSEYWDTHSETDPT